MGLDLGTSGNTTAGVAATSANWGHLCGALLLVWDKQPRDDLLSGSSLRYCTQQKQQKRPKHMWVIVFWGWWVQARGCLLESLPLHPSSNVIHSRLGEILASTKNEIRHEPKERTFDSHGWIVYASGTTPSWTSSVSFRWPISTPSVVASSAVSFRSALACLFETFWNCRCHNTVSICIMIIKYYNI